MRMFNPPHPGEIILDMCLQPLGLTITAAAKGLKISRKTLSELINGHSRVTSDMALRFEKAFGSTAEVWLGLQHEYDLWQLRKNVRTVKVTPFHKSMSIESRA
jgi:antitoxin HigA-1